MKMTFQLSICGGQPPSICFQFQKYLKSIWRGLRGGHHLAKMSKLSHWGCQWSTLFGTFSRILPFFWWHLPEGVFREVEPGEVKNFQNKHEKIKNISNVNTISNIKSLSHAPSCVKCLSLSPLVEKCLSNTLGENCCLPLCVKMFVPSLYMHKCLRVRWGLNPSQITRANRGR